MKLKTERSLRIRNMKTTKSASILTDKCTRIKQNDTKIIKSNFSFIKGSPLRSARGGHPFAPWAREEIIPRLSCHCHSNQSHPNQ